jgi:uncharacterized membrane protein YdjX (TVP38/TMEM64 family)
VLPAVTARRALLAALALVVTCAFTAVALPSGRAALADGVAWLRAAGGLGQVVAVAAVVVLIPLGVPTLWLAALVGYVHGASAGLPTSILAVFLGANLAFAIARWLLRDEVDALVARRRRWRAAVDAVTEGGVRLVVLLRLAGPHNLLNVALAGSSLSQRQFAAGTFVGSLPSVSLATLGGALAPDAASLWQARDQLGAAWIVMLVVGAAALLLAVAVMLRATRRALARGVAAAPTGGKLPSP